MSNILAKPGQVVKLRYTSPFRDEALFPRARVLDENSGDIVKTVDLSANSNIAHVYENDYTTESDEGVYWVQYTPFTNSGHTTIAENESEAQDTLTVQTIAKAQPTALGGAAITVNDIEDIARQVAEILERKIDNKLKNLQVNLPELKFDETKILDAIKNNKVEIPKSTPVNISPLVRSITSLDKKIEKSAKDTKRAIGEIKIPEPIKPDNKPVLQAISAIEFPTIPTIDLSGVTNRMQSIENLMKIKVNDLVNQVILVASNLEKDILILMKVIENNKEVMFKMDELQKKRLDDLVNLIKISIVKMPFRQNLMLQGALNKLNRNIALQDEL